MPDVALPRSRKASIEQQWIDPRSAAPATFFLSRNHGLDHDDDLSSDEPDASRTSMYGVQSLEESILQTSQTASVSQSDQIVGSKAAGVEPISTSQSPNRDDKEDDDDQLSGLNRRRSTLKPLDTIHSNRLDASITSDLISPRPFTPLNLSNPDDPSSLPSSPKSTSNQSMRHLDEISITDDLSSQAVASGEEDDDARSIHNSEHDSTSQFIMPSIKMPSRRPFTSRGKSLGRFKILVAGASGKSSYLQIRSVCDPAECVLTDAAGSGKSSLIRSIVQACEDIVHVDDFPPTYTSTPSRTSLTTIQLSQAHRLPLSTTSEIYASTKPYPSWWSDLEDSRVLRRRRSTGDVVLERNICFVDTPATSLSRTGQVDAIIHYIRQQLFRATTAIDSCNHDFQNLLAGQGGTQVDAVLYLVSAGMYSRLVRSR